MPTGVLSDCLLVFVGAFAGCLIGSHMPETLRKELNILLGFSSLSIGINSLIKVSSMAPVIFAVLLGYVIGYFLQLEKRLTALMGSVVRHLPLPQSRGFSMDQYITAVVLFCASGFGIYATFVEAMTGDPSILLSKAVLDMITALIFAITLGWATVILPVFMLVVLMLMYALGHVIAPLATPEMLQNFTACGGILTIAAGFRVSGIKPTAITNLIPALILVMPLTWLWMLLPF